MCLYPERRGLLRAVWSRNRGRDLVKLETILGGACVNRIDAAWREAECCGSRLAALPYDSALLTSASTRSADAVAASTTASASSAVNSPFETSTSPSTTTVSTFCGNPE